MPKFDWLLQSVEDKMDVSQGFTDSPRTLVLMYLLNLSNQLRKKDKMCGFAEHFIVFSTTN